MPGRRRAADPSMPVAAAVDRSDDDEATDRHPRVAAASPAEGVLYDQGQDHGATAMSAAAHADPDTLGRPTDHDDGVLSDADHGDDQYPPDEAPAVWEETGGLEVIGAEPEEGRGRQGRRTGGGGGSGRTPGGRRQRRARRPITIVVSLAVLAGLVVGIVFGGQWLIGKVNPTAADYTGQGTGHTQIRVSTGDSLTAIGRTLAEADVIASTGPFVTAASANPAATGIQPGVYDMRLQMSGQAALDRLLDPASRLFARVTIPEGYTVEQTLERLSEATDTPLAELQAAAADPSQLGLPAWAMNQLEGFLYPLTYDFEPDATATQMLQKMVAEFTETAAELQLEQRAAAAGRSPYDVMIVASMVQSETLQDDERVDVAQVIYNRLADNMTLGIDATLAYGLGKNGNDLTVTDLNTPSPYNTRTQLGLPPTPISAPGEASLEAALSPSMGDLLFYVLEDREGNHFFTNSDVEFEAARQRCAEAGLGCGPG